jgi:sec-independent protein translocase protein TatB
MLDFSLGEFGLIAVVALLALGPERLPKLAHTAGALMRRARMTWQNARDDIEREFAADELAGGVGVAKQIADDLRREIETSPGETKSSAADTTEMATHKPAETDTNKLHSEIP